MRVCIAGKNQIAIDALRFALSKMPQELVVACPNDHDDGRSGWQPSLRRYATELGVPIITLEEAANESDLLFISLEVNRIIRPKRFRSRRLFNIHFSKLPAYKGVYTSAWPILNGETESGVTLHRIDAGIDTGEIVAQRTFKLAPNETARSLYFKYLEEGFDLFRSQFDHLVSDAIESQPQPIDGSTYYSKASINYSELTVDLNQTACTLDRQVRAYSFREFQQSTIHGMPVATATSTSDRSRKRPGSVLYQSNEGIMVATIDYDVWLTRDRSLELIELVNGGSIVSTAELADLKPFVDIADRNGWTPLMMASYKGDATSCNALIKLGADVNKGNCNGTTALMFAKEHGELTGDFSVCSLLIDQGADLQITDCFGRSVADYCEIRQQRRAGDYFRTKLHKRTRDTI